MAEQILCDFDDIKTIANNARIGNGEEREYLIPELGDAVLRAIAIGNNYKHLGIIGQWAITETITATLYDDGTFAVAGIGTAPSFASDNLPPWNSPEFLSNIKKIVLNESITYGSLAYWFSGESNGKTYGTVTERFDVPSTVTIMPVSAFRGLKLSHINCAKCQRLNTISTFRLDYGQHMILSVPTAICNNASVVSSISGQTIIQQIAKKIKDTANSGSRSEVLLVITDSKELKNAIYDEVLSVTPGSNLNVLPWNFGVIYCDELGVDGFPKYWTQNMKRIFPEIMPYIGRQFMYYYDSDESKYPVTGLTSMNTYGGYGWPNDYSRRQQRILLYRYATGVGKEEYENSENQIYVSDYIAQPTSTALEALTTGLRCAGFVNWLYWRYFGENFTLSMAEQIYEGVGRLGNPLPLEEIDDANELRPFDICVYVKDGGLDENGKQIWNDTHVAIYMDTANDGTIRVIDSWILGVSFNRFKFKVGEEPSGGYRCKYYRFNKEGFSYGLLRQE